MWLACLIAMSHGWRCKCKCVPCILPCLLGVPRCLRYNCTCAPCTLPCLLALSQCWRYTNVQVHDMCISCLLVMSHLWRYKCTRVPCALPCLSHCWRYKCICMPCALPCLLAVSHCWRYKCTCVPCALPRLYVIPWNVQMCMCTMRITTPVCHTLKCTNVHVCHVHYHTCMSYLEMYKCSCVPCALPRLYVIPWNVQMFMCAMCITTPVCHTLKCTNVHVCHACCHAW